MHQFDDTLGDIYDHIEELDQTVPRQTLVCESTHYLHNGTNFQIKLTVIFHACQSAWFYWTLLDFEIEKPYLLAMPMLFLKAFSQ